MQFYNSNGAGSFLPPSPIGNVTSPLPYGGMYSNYSYYNPWEAQRRQDEAIKQYNSQVTDQINICKALVKNANARFGINVSDAELDEEFSQYKPKYTNSHEYYQKQQENMRNAHIEKVVQSPYPLTPNWAETRMEVFAKEEEAMSKRYEGKSLEEQYKTLTEIAFELREEEGKKARKNLNGTYNRGDYQSLLNTLSSNRNSMNVDDLEIELPINSISDEYANRRLEFLAKVMKK